MTRTAVPTPPLELIAEPQVSARPYLRDDLARPAREITSRHRVHERSLLLLTARCDAVAAGATRLYAKGSEGVAASIPRRYRNYTNRLLESFVTRCDHCLGSHHPNGRATCPAEESQSVAVCRLTARFKRAQRREDQVFWISESEYILHIDIKIEHDAAV
jgi:hypothetical protein